MKVTATKEFTFDSAHLLSEYDGECARLHGHTYRLQVTLQRKGKDQLILDGPKAFMVVDFKDIKQHIKEHVLDKLDHRNLNEVLDFRTTAENLALYLYKRINEVILPPVRCVRVRLWETPTSFVEVEE